MSKLKVVSFVFAAAAIVSSAILVQADPFGPGHPPDGPMFPLKMLVSLNLSASQKTEVGEIINRYRDRQEVLHAQLMEANERVQNIINAEALNEEEVRLSFRETSPLMEEVVVLQAKMMSEIKALLNPDQLESLKEIQKEHTTRMQVHRQWGKSMSDTGLETGSE
jgi:Spy/CpxP family protein refolding chaperone